MLLGTAAAILISMFAGFSADCDKLYGSTFRLHILANSDSVRDQQIKYAVRDHILTDMSEKFADCRSKASAKETAERELAEISRQVNGYLRELGCEYTASCFVENTYFPTRVYADCTLPAGYYDALRVVIGSGEGQNWWCVLYPSVCLQAASLPESSVPRRELYEQRKAANRSSADSLKAQRGEIEFRFAVYDLLRSLFVH